METASNSKDQIETRESSEIDPLIPKPPSPSRWRSKRFIVGVLLFFGYFVNSMVYQVINITVVKMTLRKQEEQLYEFNSRDTLQNPILIMYWYGFMFSVIGGHLAQKFGGSVVLGVSTLLSGLFTVATWFSVHHGFDYLIACHVFLGIFQGFSSASYSAVFASWAPKEERYTFMFYVIHGMFFGDYVVYLLYKYLPRYWGWPMIFLVVGALSITWAVLWLIMVRNAPSDDPSISKSELDYILEGTGNPVPNKSDLPYRKILKSPSFWALEIGQFAISWGSAVGKIYFLFFIRDVCGKKVSLSTLFVSNIFFFPIIFELLYRFVRRNPQTKKFSKKGIILRFWALNSMIFIISNRFRSHLSFTIFCFDIIISPLSYNKIYLDIITVNMAPNHAAVLSGLTSFWKAIGIILMQTVIGLEAGNKHFFDWERCFGLMSTVNLVCVVIFGLFGSNSPQPWSVGPSSRNDCKKGDNTSIEASSENPHREQIGTYSLPKRIFIKICNQIEDSW